MDPRFRAAVLFGLFFGATPRALAQPEARGRFTVMTYDAGPVPADRVTIPTKVYYSMSVMNAPVVAVVHGYLRRGANMTEMAMTFASRGFVAVVPDMPCGLAGCDHAANGRQIAALLDWAVAQSAVSTSPLHLRVDSNRRGVVGHSWGGLGVFLAAAQDPRIRSLVVLDPNDDNNQGLASAATETAASLLVAAEVQGACNATNWSMVVYPQTPQPKLRVRVRHSGHCDVENPSDSLCPAVCGAGMQSTSPIFRRYAVAFTACVLQSDASMAGYIGGMDLMHDQQVATIDNVDQQLLNLLPCRGGPGSDGGRDSGRPPDVGPLDASRRDASVDGAPGVDVDANIEMSPDADLPDVDSGIEDAIERPRLPPGPAMRALMDKGCSCETRGNGGRDPRASHFALALLALSLLALRRRAR